MQKSSFKLKNSPTSLSILTQNAMTHLPQIWRQTDTRKNYWHVLCPHKQRAGVPAHSNTSLLSYWQIGTYHNISTTLVKTLYKSHCCIKVSKPILIDIFSVIIFISSISFCTLYLCKTYGNV